MRLRIVGLLLLLLVPGFWVWFAIRSIDGFAVVVPLPGSSELNLDVWMAPPPLRLVLWHRALATGVNEHLASLVVPSWVVVAAAAGIVAAAMGLVTGVAVLVRLWLTRVQQPGQA